MVEVWLTGMKVYAYVGLALTVYTIIQNHCMFHVSYGSDHVTQMRDVPARRIYLPCAGHQAGGWPQMRLRPHPQGRKCQNLMPLPGDISQLVIKVNVGKNSFLCFFSPMNYITYIYILLLYLYICICVCVCLCAE